MRLRSNNEVEQKKSHTKKKNGVKHSSVELKLLHSSNISGDELKLLHSWALVRICTGSLTRLPSFLPSVTDGRFLDGVKFLRKPPMPLLRGVALPPFSSADITQSNDKGRDMNLRTAETHKQTHFLRSEYTCKNSRAWCIGIYIHFFSFLWHTNRKLSVIPIKLNIYIRIRIRICTRDVIFWFEHEHAPSF